MPLLVPLMFSVFSVWNIPGRPWAKHDRAKLASTIAKQFTWSCHSLRYIWYLSWENYGEEHAQRTTIFHLIVLTLILCWFYYFMLNFSFFYLKDFFIFSLSGIVSLGMMVAPSMIMPPFGTQSCSYTKHDYLDQAHSPTSMLSTILVLLAWPCSPWLFELTWFIFSCRLCWRSTLLQSLLRDPWVGDPAPNGA